VLADPAEQLIRFLGVYVWSIKGVQSDPPFSVLAPRQRAKLTFTLRVQLLVAQKLRSQRGQKLVLRQVELDAEVVRTADGFENLTPVAARLKEMSILEQVQDLLTPIQELPNPGESPPGEPH
jgi:hypothetical protein